ncbi:beta-ketoacyl-ACP synthase III [Anaplasma phagocytophilum]|nr:beta-ketoacyl-ACP synthase III [Anaplasma phagocytophilum]KJV82730.1 3-oxoacyl-[acyl-carrier-] synthase III family protein [Anaplasma phagocytophilum str. HGE2]KJV88283.1 3-oxoacyl-[acyl-carrier-] synthase III family protein [Anaplasma phagocytophilum str. ApNYW]KJV99383.1 3-oxoacyl-[acyl-carrier-] synthase III family protein [Anaplasma phagocytophilum str. Annie]PLC10481.1 ketoacyl-ACP synthase III [Anaplasma phagocytophilum]
MMKAVLCGVGSFLPHKAVTNEDLSLIVDTTDEWIFRRTGIKRRYLVSEGEATSDMAVKAAEAALSDAGVSAEEVDLIVVATSTPDSTLPSCATMVQGKLGCTKAFAFDMNAACSGFVYAISVVDSLIKTGQVGVALLIGAESMSKIVDWHDRSTCVLFGDGAGACVFKGDGKASNRGIVDTALYTDGTLGDILYTDGGVASTCTAGHIRMKGTVLFEHAILKLSSSVEGLLKKNAIGIDAIDWFIPHQANVRIVDLVAKRLGISQDKVVLGIGDHANTSAASIPLAMSDARRDGKLQEGQLVLLAAIGAGVTWGASLIRL